MTQLLNMIQNEIEEELLESQEMQIEEFSSKNLVDTEIESNITENAYATELQISDKVALTGGEKAARKPYRITDFDTPRDKEMAVFTHAKKLSEYIFVITEKSPKKYRWSIITRLQNASVELIENLYSANYEKEAQRQYYQTRAQVKLSLIDFYSETAKCKQAITIKQTAVIARQVYEIRKLLNGWKRVSAKQAK